MVTKLSLIAGAVLVITPAAVTVALPPKHDAGVFRSVEVDAPVIGFNQYDNRIQLQLKPATTDAERTARQRVVIRSPSGEEMHIALKTGQIWASAQLTGDFAKADTLKISVE